MLPSITRSRTSCNHRQTTRRTPSAENLPLAAVNQGIVEEIALLFGAVSVPPGPELIRRLTNQT